MTDDKLDLEQLGGRQQLSLEEVQSFRLYALENQTENDGTQCQWADYTLRALDELDRLRNAAPKLFERVRELEAQIHQWEIDAAEVGGELEAAHHLKQQNRELQIEIDQLRAHSLSPDEAADGMHTVAVSWKFEVAQLKAQLATLERERDGLRELEIAVKNGQWPQMNDALAKLDALRSEKAPK